MLTRQLLCQGTPITLTTKTAVRYRGIVATTAAQGNTTGVTLSDVKDLSAPGTPLKPSIFIASTNIESYVPEPLRINLTSNDCEHLRSFMPLN